MILLEDVDPELIDQAVRSVLSLRRAVDREQAIANHLSQSRELMEWVEMAAESDVPVIMRVLAMAGICLEVGYELGENEARREKKRA